MPSASRHSATPLSLPPLPSVEDLRSPLSRGEGMILQEGAWGAAPRPFLKTFPSPIFSGRGRATHQYAPLPGTRLRGS